MVWKSAMARKRVAIDEADAPIVRLVSMLLVEAHRAGASDIHLEPMDKKFRVRFRDRRRAAGNAIPPKRLQSAIISRLKIMTGTMSIAEKRLPQDGRIQVRIKKNRRSSRLDHPDQPWREHGHAYPGQVEPEARLAGAWLSLRRPGDVRAPDEVARTAFCLVTGPTGSGKTTTLYACLNFINRPDRKIITVEDPVEYQMTGINQVQVKRRSA